MSLDRSKFTDDKPVAKQATQGDRLSVWRSFVGDLMASAAFGENGYVRQITLRRGKLSDKQESSARRRARDLRAAMEHDFPCSDAPEAYRRNIRWQTAIKDAAALIRYESAGLIPKRPADLIAAERARRSGITEAQRQANATALAEAF